MSDKAKKPPADIIKSLIYAKDKVGLFRQIEKNKQAIVLNSLPRRFKKEILNLLNDDELTSALNHIAPDKATDIIQELSGHRSKTIASKLDKSIKEKVEFLLKFNPKAAAGIMTLDFVVVSPKSNFENVAEEIKDHEKKTGKIPAVLVAENGSLKGEVPAHNLALHSKNEIIKDSIQRLPHVRYDENERKVVNLFLKHPHNKIVVLDEDKDVLGIIHSDDILKLVDKGSTHHLYRLAGVNREEDILDSSFTKVNYRYRWLILNLGTSFLAAAVVGLYEETISRFILLAVFMPIVAGMGGNAGTQTLAVTIRGLVLKEVSLSTGKYVIINEMIAGAINGAIIGVVVGIIAVVFYSSYLLAVILAAAMVINLIVAGFFGAIVPMFMRSIGKDPASSATIFITTATDVFGFFVFLGLASVLLS